MSTAALKGMDELAQNAGKAAGLLKLVANEHRLMILCRLGAEREVAVGTLGEAVSLSQSALSQHLARMREEGLVATRRAAQTIYYRIADPDVRRLLATLKSIYCR